MTPYRERREAGYYDAKPKNTTSSARNVRVEIVGNTEAVQRATKSATTSKSPTPTKRRSGGSK
jgi:hypothetical protein